MGKDLLPGGGNFRRPIQPQCCSDKQRTRYPMLCSLLEGWPDSREERGSPPYELKLSVGTKSMRFGFSCRATGHSLFGSAEGFDEVLDSVEKALQEGKYDQKQYDNSRGGETL